MTRLNENAHYEALSGQPNHISEYANGGVISDQIILLHPSKTALKARLIVYNDPLSGKVFKFVSNMVNSHDMTITQLYRHRWNIEVLFKKIKQNFELGYFFSDSTEGIKTQVWMVLIANLLFSVIHRQYKEAEMFITFVSLAAINMGSYISLIKMVKSGRLTVAQSDFKVVQLDLFETKEGERSRKTSLILQETYFSRSILI